MSPVADAARSAPSAARTGTKSSDSGPSADLFAAMVDGGERIDDPSPAAPGAPAPSQRVAGDASLATQGNAKPAIVTDAAAIATSLLPQLQAAQNQDVPAEPAPPSLPPDPAMANPGTDVETDSRSGNADSDGTQSAEAEPTAVALASVPADPALANPSGGMVLATAAIAPQPPVDTAPVTEQRVIGAVAAAAANSVPQQVEPQSVQPGMTAAANTGQQPQTDAAELPVSTTTGPSPDTFQSVQVAEASARTVNGETNAADGGQIPSPANSGDTAQPGKTANGANQTDHTDPAGDTPAASDTGLRAQKSEAGTAAAVQSHAASSSQTTAAHDKLHAAARNESAAENAPTVPAATASVQPASVNMTHWTHLTAIPMTTPIAASVLIDANGNTSQIAAGSVPLTGLAVEIASRAAAGNTRFEIRLDPPELGRIDVRLDVDSKGQVTSHLTVERTDTLDLLRREAPQLQRALQDAGLKTGDSALHFSLRDQSAGNGANADDGSRRRADQILIETDEVMPAEITSRGYGRLLGATGGLDIRV